MSSVWGDDISRLKLDEESHKVLRDYHDGMRECAAKARGRLEILGIGFAVSTTARLGCAGSTVAAGPDVGSGSAQGAGSASGGAGVVVEGSVEVGDDEPDWGVMIYATAVVEGCKNIEDALDALFDTYRSPLTLDDVAKTLLKAGVSKAGSGELAERVKSLKSTIYSLAAQKPHLRCSGGMIERVDVAGYGEHVGAAVVDDVARQTA